jgi:hypothetical protein
LPRGNRFNLVVSSDTTFEHKLERELQARSEGLPVRRQTSSSRRV